MKRQHWLIVAVLLLVVGNVLYHIWGNWGLITVHSTNKPLSEVIRSIEKQGHVTIRTNLDPTKPVHMDVDHVALAEALETLSVVTDSRWHLSYFVGPDKATVDGAVASFVAGQRPEGWKNFYVPLMQPVGEEPDVLPDPRTDSWAVKAVDQAQSTVQAYLQQASRNVSASFSAPESWNPAVKSAPSAGPIGKALPKLVTSAGGKYQEVFVLQGDQRRQARENGDRQPPQGDDGPRLAGNFGGGRPGGGRGGFDREAMEERAQAEINKLTGEAKAQAQRELDERKKFFEEMRNLTPEQRQAKMEDWMSQPANQERMENAQNQRDSRQSPEQRISRAQGYLQRMQAARNH